MTLATDQLDIMLTAACQAQCAFCVQEATFKPADAGSSSLLAAIRRHSADFRSLGGRKIVLTGGEPLLVPERVFGALDVLKEVGPFDLVALYTNGEYLATEGPTGMDPASLLDRLASSCLTHVNLSVHHWDDRLNNSVLRRPGKSATSEIAAALCQHGIKFRLNLVLQKDVVDSAAAVLKYIDWGFELGAVDIYVRELFRFTFDQPLSRSRFDPLPYVRSAYVDAKPIVEELMGIPELVLAERVDAHGRRKSEYRFVHGPTARDVFIADLEVGSEDRDASPYLVIMPDGQLYRGWLGARDRIGSMAEAPITGKVDLPVSASM